MGANESTLAALRAVLAEKFPSVAAKPGGVSFPLGLGSGELRRGVLTEFSSSTGNGALFLHALLATARTTRTFAALIDAGRTFDPPSYDRAALAGLLWVQCETAEQAVKCADLLLRDGNLPLLALDLQALPRRALGRIPASTWHRFHRLVEQSGVAFVILTAQPMIEGARVRLAVRQRWTLRALRQRRRALLAQCELQTFDRTLHFARKMESTRHVRRHPTPALPPPGRTPPSRGAVGAAGRARR